MGKIPMLHVQIFRFDPQPWLLTPTFPHCRPKMAVGLAQGNGLCHLSKKPGLCSQLLTLSSPILSAVDIWKVNQWLGHSMFLSVFKINSNFFF